LDRKRPGLHQRYIEEVTKQVCKGAIEEQVEAAAQKGIARLNLNNKRRKEKREKKRGRLMEVKKREPSL
jgi:hypothetical protein